MAESSPALHIPDYAIDLMHTIAGNAPQFAEYTAGDVRQIAAPVVAAELRRLADEIGASGWRHAARPLHVRADELDGGGE